MKKLIILVCVIGCGVFAYNKFFGGGTSMVPFGENAALERAGFKEVLLDGTFFAEDYIETGLPTVIEFCSNDCKGCKLLNNDHIKRFLRVRNDVAVRKITIADHWRPEEMERRHKIHIYKTPFVLVYGPDGQLIASDEEGKGEGFKFLYKWINHEVNRNT